MNKIYTLLIISVLGCVSCGDFLEEDSQTLSYVTSVEVCSFVQWVFGDTWGRMTIGSALFAFIFR